MHRKGGGSAWKAYHFEGAGDGLNLALVQGGDERVNGTLVHVLP